MEILSPPLQTVMRLIQSNRIPEAAAFLHAHLRAHPEDDHAWYLLAYLTTARRERIVYLKQCLLTNPDNILAKAQLEKYQPAVKIPGTPLQSSEIKTTAITTKNRPTEKINVPLKGLLRFLTFSLKRGFSIAFTIILGVFLTILIVNQTGQVDNSVLETVKHEVNQLSYTGYFDGLSIEERFVAKDAEVERRADLIGLNLPYLTRNLKWTARFLTLNWGEALFPRRVSQHLMQLESNTIKDIILAALPNTLLLMGVSYLVIFLIGIPLALFLSRHNATFIDRFFTFLSPLSSIPSWVIGILLMLVIAVQFKLLPIDGMYDTIPPSTNIGYIEVVARHMILPVLSIVISLFFQLVYSWRTYFLLFSEEDYVELALAKGLPNRILQKKYILRPGIPYVVTSFALTFVSFWQTTTALEVVFQWPGIGYTYIKALPHFFGEAMFPGDLLVAVAIVVVFAYLLGLLVFLLDIIYALVDPRIRIGNQDDVRVKIMKRHNRNHQKARWKRITNPTETIAMHVHPHHHKTKLKPLVLWKKMRPKIKSFWTDLIRYPSAVIGLTIILLFIIGSFYAVLAYPYQESGREWYTNRLTGQARVPRLAKPAWTNLFRSEKLPETITLNSALGEAHKQISRNPDGSDEITLTYSFAYPYDDIPQDVIIYYESTYTTKTPFAVVTWITPDGKEYAFNGSATKDISFNLTENISMRRYLRDNPEWSAWLSTDAIQTGSALWVLFAQPHAETPILQQGTYQVRIDALSFEEGNDLDAELVLIGKVFGAGGTDFMRRDLMFPLLWGLPYVIFFGLFGALVTTVLALIVAAVGVWFGGWVDNLIQRITEANMILPILAIAILIHVIFGVSMTIIIIGVILMNVFSTPTKTFRAAFMQIKDSLYIEAAQVYGASNARLVFTYMIPRVLPIIIPQLVILIPGFIFLEATFGLFNIRSMYPTWGRIIYEALREGAQYGSHYWVLEPLFMLLLTAFAFTLLGSALDRVLNPRLKKD